MNQSPKPLILVDGSSYLYRAFHAMPSLSNSKGKLTGAVYGMINMLKKLINDYQPELMAVVFDAKGKTFRDELYDKYKAHRPEMPNELAQQIEPIHEIIRALGVPLIMIEGVEADDIIGTLAMEAIQQKIPTLISTSDKDLAQLVNPHITLINTMTGNILNPDTVKEKFGIPPTSIVDYLALVGDTVDNIPGIPQVGPKTAAKWLQEYGSLDNIVTHANKITGKVGENLRASLSQLPLAKALATIKLDVKLNIHFNEVKRKEPNNENLIKLYQELEFKTWLSELLEKNPNTNQTKYENYQIILSLPQLENWLTKLSQVGLFALNIEASHGNYMDAKLLGISFALEKGEAAYVPFNQELSQDIILKKLQPILENSDIKKVGHNFKYDLEVLANAGIQLRGAVFDIMLESYILDSSNNNHDIDSLALKYLGWRTIAYEEIAGKGAKQISFEQISLEAAARYATESADVCFQLHQLLWQRLNEHPGLKHIYEAIEIPLYPVLAMMERTGVLIDAKMLVQQSKELEIRLQQIEKEAFSMAGGEFNMNSPKQLQEIFFQKLKLPVLQKTPTGQPSTADAVLQELALEYPLPRLIIEYRSLSKLMTTYTKKLPEQINTTTHRVHTCYNQTVASTGRLSSTEPNLQNIPIKTEEGRRIRKAFIAGPGNKIITADYSQIELRIMAHISGDPTLLKAFADNLDIHIATAAEVLGITIERVTTEERRNAKAVNFGLIYGMSSFGLAKQIGVDRQQAQTYITRYFTRYPKVKEYMERTCAQAHEKGFVETLSGRRLYLPDINSSQIPRQKAAERAAINAPLQGTAADIIKRAMISLHGWLQENSKINAKMIMQVHDELVFEVAENEVDAFIPIIRSHMMAAAKLDVPLVVDIGVGDNWNQAAEDDE